MASEQAMLDAFLLLEAAGFRTPGAWEDGRGVKMGLIAYGAVMRDVGDDDLMKGTIAFIESGEKFWPQPGLLKSFVPSKAIAALEDGEEAWGELLDSISRHGRYNPPGTKWDFDGTDLQRAAMHAGLQSVGGWSTLCSKDASRLDADRASFRKTYRSVLKRGAIVEQSEDIGRYLNCQPSIKLLINKGQE